jgi:hypothetical protein
MARGRPHHTGHPPEQASEQPRAMPWAESGRAFGPQSAKDQAAPGQPVLGGIEQVEQHLAYTPLLG